MQKTGRVCPCLTRCSPLSPDSEWDVFGQLGGLPRNVFAEVDVLLFELHFATELGFNSTDKLDRVDDLVDLLLERNRFEVFYLAGNCGGTVYPALRDLGGECANYEVGLVNTKSLHLLRGADTVFKEEIERQRLGRS